MSELRIGNAISEPANGTLKVGSSNVQEIYLGSTKIWPTVSPGLDDPYVPIADNTDPRFVGTEPVNINSSQSSAYVRIYDVYGNTINTLGTIATPTANPSIAGAYYCISTASDNCDYLWARPYITGLVYGYIIRSNDRGATWVETPIPSHRQSGDPQAFTPSIEQSRDGKYVITIPPAPFTTPLISSDYGVNSSAIGGLLNFDKEYAAAGMSAGGKYIYLTYVPSGASVVQVYRSDDYGQTFSNITTSVNLQATISGYNGVFSYKPLVNATGSKVVFAFVNRSYTTSKFGNISSISTDYGVTYSKISQQMYGYRLYSSPAVSRNAAADGSRYIWNAGQSARSWSSYDSSLTTSALQDIGNNADQSMTSVSNYGGYGVVATRRGVATTTRMYFNSFSNTAGYASSGFYTQHAVNKMQLAVNIL
jgi:hypothetical protein